MTISITIHYIVLSVVMLSVAIIWLLCWVSLCWVSLCLVSWRPWKTESLILYFAANFNFYGRKFTDFTTVKIVVTIMNHFWGKKPFFPGAEIESTQRCKKSFFFQRYIEDKGKRATHPSSRTTVYRKYNWPTVLVSSVHR